MNEAFTFKDIDPRGFTLNGDASIQYSDRELHEATAAPTAIAAAPLVSNGDCPNVRCQNTSCGLSTNTENCNNQIDCNLAENDLICENFANCVLATDSGTCTVWGRCSS
jgi:hypothetical protein